MINKLWQCARDEGGATAIEYSLIAGLVGIVIVAGVTLLGTDLAAIFQSLADSM